MPAAPITPLHVTPQAPAQQRGMSGQQPRTALSSQEVPDRGPEKSRVVQPRVVPRTGLHDNAAPGKQLSRFLHRGGGRQRINR